MIKKIINGIFKLVQNLISAMLGPIWLIINNNIPHVIIESISYIGFIFNFVSNSIFWCIDFLCIPTQAIQIIAYYYIFKLTVPVLSYGVKLGLKWYHMLVP